MKKLFNFISRASFMVLFAVMISTMIGAPALLGVGVAFGSQFIPKAPMGAMGMAVEVELWRPDIIEELFKDNEFLKHSFNADDYVLAGAVVHIPQSGGPANVEKNRAVFPAVNVKRADTDVTYPLDEYTTDPVLIQNAEQVEVSYDKRQSVISENLEGIKEYTADDMLINWSKNITATGKLKTTGDAVPAAAPDATGNRKGFTEKDLMAARDWLNKAKVAKKDRFILLPTEWITQLQTEMQNRFYYKDVVNLPEGSITKLHGFFIMERSEVLVVDNADAIKALGSASAITDSQAALFWQKNMVERALGTVKMFESLDDPNNYGDTYSFLVRAGGRGRRADGKGVGIIIQETV